VFVRFLGLSILLESAKKDQASLATTYGVPSCI
jgi:hypothetical protein